MDQIEGIVLGLHKFLLDKLPRTSLGLSPNDDIGLSVKRRMRRPIGDKLQTACKKLIHEQRVFLAAQKKYRTKRCAAYRIARVTLSWPILAL